MKQNTSYAKDQKITAYLEEVYLIIKAVLSSALIVLSYVISNKKYYDFFNSNIELSFFLVVLILYTVLQGAVIITSSAVLKKAVPFGERIKKLKHEKWFLSPSILLAAKQTLILSVTVIISGIFIPLIYYHNIGSSISEIFPLLLFSSFALICGALPAGFYSTARIYMALSTANLKKRNQGFGSVFPTGFSAFEKMGNVVAAVFNKTGVLTSSLEVSHIYTSKGEEINLKLLPEKSIESGINLLELAHCCLYGISKQNNPTTNALLSAMSKLSEDDKTPLYNMRNILPFDSSNRVSVCICEGGGAYYVVAIGEFNNLIEFVKTRLEPEAPLSEIDGFENVKSIYKEYTKNKKLCVLGVACKRISHITKHPERERLERHLKFFGLIGFSYEINKDTLKVFNDFSELSIKNIIITSDSLPLSEHFAKQMGLLNNNNSDEIIQNPLSEEEIRFMNDDELARRVSYVTIYSGLSQSSKERVLKIIRENINGKMLFIANKKVSPFIFKETDISSVYFLKPSSEVLEENAKIGVDLTVSDIKALPFTVRKSQKIQKDLLFLKGLYTLTAFVIIFGTLFSTPANSPYIFNNMPVKSIIIAFVADVIALIYIVYVSQRKS